MKAVAYARVSTSTQDLAVQLEEIQHFAARKGWKLVATYSDIASGAREDRTDFRRLVTDAAKGKFGHIMAAIGQFERALIGDRIRSGLERARALRKSVGRPRARVSPNQVLALRAQGLSFRAVARHFRISPALAHRLAHDMPVAALAGRSETPAERLETDPDPCASSEAIEGHHAPATGVRRTP